MQDFFSGKLIGVAAIFLAATGYSAYKFMDHSANFIAAEGRVSAVREVCSGSLDIGSGEQFSCDLYDGLVAQKKRVYKIQAVSIRYTSPVDNSVHSAELAKGGAIKVDSVVPIYVSKSDPNKIDFR
jgi:hypothetical protein